MDYVTLAARITLGLVFLVSAATKLRSRSAWQAFRISVRQLEILPAAWVLPAAALTAAAEVAIVVLLVVPATTSAGFAVAAGLLVVFSGAILLSLRHGVRAPCRCFGRSSRPLGPPHVFRNTFLVAVAVSGAVTSQRASGLPLDPGGVVVAAVAGLTVAVVTVIFDDLVDLFAPTLDGSRTAPSRTR